MRGARGRDCSVERFVSDTGDGVASRQATGDGGFKTTKYIDVG